MDGKNAPGYWQIDHAFPVSTIDGFTQRGLTKRELFAAMAMQAVVTAAASWGPLDFSRDIDNEQVASFAKGQADALLAALNAEESK